VLNTTLKIETLKYWHTWDEDGIVNPNETGPPIDGERYAILLQDKDSREDGEEFEQPVMLESQIRLFIKRKHRRREKPRVKIDMVSLLSSPEPGFFQHLLSIP
jgi:hypothetical protein